MSVISREAAIEAIESHLRVGDEVYPLTRTDKILNHAFEIAASCVYNLPSAEVTLCHLDSPCEYQNADIAMPSAQQWIPCSERQPEETNLYWVTVKPIDSEILEVTQRWYFGRGYGDGWEAELYEPPLAWMPMEWPDPWKGETDDSM